MNYTECIENARPRLGKYCKACPECNGRACKNQMPGPGSKGIGDTAIRNYDKWKQIRVNMDTIAENKPVDTSLSLFGRTFKYPVFAGPVGAVQLHYGDCLDDVTYNDILVSACAKNGIAAFTGDGTDPNVMAAATKAIKNADGAGIPTVKPWNIETIREKMKLVHESGAFAVAMDIDAAGLPFLKNLDPPAGSKTVSELCDIIQMAGTPFIVKGIMTVKGALKAKEAGASAIIVSNHGVRCAAATVCSLVCNGHHHFAVDILGRAQLDARRCLRKAEDLTERETVARNVRPQGKALQRNLGLAAECLFCGGSAAVEVGARQAPVD